MKMQAVGQTQHTFAQSPAANIPRSVFNRGHGHKTTWGLTNTANNLVPIFVDEALPGDTFVCKMSAFIRLIPTVVPIMDNLYFDFFFFAVPNRLLWQNWYKFMGAQDNPGDSTSYVNPVVTTPSGGWLQTTIADHFGIPILISGMPNVNALPFRAYQLIWNQWFRDQNLQNSVTVNTGDGPDSASTYGYCLPRGKRHDYFTSCLPLPQKAPAVNLPLSSTLPVNFQYASGTPFSEIRSGTTGVPYPTNSAALSSGAATSYQLHAQITDPVIIDSSQQYKVDASAAATINQLRQSFQLQKLYERDNRGGTRLTEIIRSHFGVISPDARMQRPEFLGGGSIPCIMSPVPQTSVTASTPQANLAAYGTAASPGNIGFTYSATEHCILIGLAAARADLTYQQGLDRMWSRSTRFDYYWPALSHLGEQSVLNQEIFVQGNSNDALTFGYQERYAEYRYKPSKITNEFNSNAATPLDFWHLSEKYTSLPTLGSTWISSGPPLSRVVAVTSTDPILADFYFDLKCARPMPVYSIPGLVDHF